MSDHDDDLLAERMEAEDRLRDKAPHSHMFGSIEWIDGRPRWVQPRIRICVERVPGRVRDRYRTGGKPTTDLNNNAARDAGTSQAA